jgi:hypothetical protein
MVGSARNILSREGDDVFRLEVWNQLHPNAPRALASFFHCDQDEGSTLPFELPASSQTSLLTR